MMFPFKIENRWVYLDPFESRMMIRRIMGRYEPEKVELAKKYLRPGFVAVDVGVNKGFFTTLFSKLVGPTGKVYSFEPVPENCKWIKKSLAKNNMRNVKLLQIALSDQYRISKFYIGKKSGFGSLYNTPSTTSETINVRLGPLFAFVKGHIDFMKLDAEGHELSILKGSPLDDISVIVMDNDNKSDHDEIVALLKKNGFDVSETREKTIIAERP